LDLSGGEMEDIFEMMTFADKEESQEIRVRLGIRLKIADHETTCPILRVCNSYGALESEVEAIKSNLERIMSRAKEIFRESSIPENLAIRPDMKPDEIWSILSHIADEDVFVQGFNGLNDPIRREVAEYVLTRCNVFSGKASVFSSRYNNESGLLE
jgi:hypothetical protein